MKHDIRSGLVRIQDGAGFVVAPNNLIITCAHVLHRFIVEGQEVEVSFYNPLTGEPVRSCAKLLSIYHAEDIAVLEIENLPTCVRPLWLGSSKQMQGKIVSTTGFPGFEGQENWSARCQIVDEVRDTSGQPRLQVQSLGGLARGFSGAPLWDEKRRRVIGMMVTILQSNNRLNLLSQNGSAIPSEHLQKVCDKLCVQDICPYKGLLSYREEEAEFFFGREDYLQELLNLLEKEHRFLMLLGPHGSGKTSLVQAGLIPLLRQNVIRGVVFSEIVTYAPEHSPLNALLAQPIFCAATTLREGLFRWKSNHTPPDRFVLIIDPFEDLFHKTDDLNRQQFISQLVEIIQGDLATIIVVIRDDYYSDLAAYGTLIQLLERQISNIPQLTVENVRDIIQKPAQAIGLGIEDNLANTIADETMSTQAEPRRRSLHRQSSVLPLLSYALQQMFDRKEDFELTASVYRQIGGISGCLPDWATQTYFSLKPEQQILARRIFTDLVVLGDESSGLLDRKREQFLKKLSRNEQELPAVREVVNRFTEAHLLETHRDEDQNEVRVGIIHETLLHEWALLQEWLREDHEFLAWHQSFLLQANNWYQCNVSTRQEYASLSLLRKNELMVALNWWEKRQSEFSEVECLFLEKSQEKVKQLEQQQEELEQAKQNQQILFAQHLASQALMLREQQPHLIELSILLAAEAVKRHPSFDTEQALRKGLQLLPRHLQHIKRTSHYRKVVTSSDGSHLAAAGNEGVVWIQNAYSDPSTSFFPEFATVHDLALSSDGAYALLLTGTSAGRNVMLVNLAQRQEPQYLKHQEAASAILCRKDEVITVTEHGRMLFWHLPTASLRYQLFHSGLTMVVLSPDERYLATASREGMVKLWNLSQCACVKRFPHERTVDFMAFHPDRPLLVTASSDQVYIWDWTLEERRFSFRKPPRSLRYFEADSTITNLALSGDNLIVVLRNRFLHLWNFYAQRYLFSYDYRTPIQAFQMHPAGYFLAGAEEDGTVFIWDLLRVDSKPAFILPHPGPVQSIAFHPDKPYLATASSGGGLRLWQYESYNQMQMLNQPMTIDDLFREARYHMTRNLTQEEWIHYLDNTPYQETFLLDWREEERIPDL